VADVPAEHVERLQLAGGRIEHRVQAQVVDVVDVTGDAVAAVHLEHEAVGEPLNGDVDDAAHAAADAPLRANVAGHRLAADLAHHGGELHVSAVLELDEVSGDDVGKQVHALAARDRHGRSFDGDRETGVAMGPPVADLRLPDHVL